MRRGSGLLEACIGLALGLVILGLLLALIARTVSGNVRGQKRLAGVRTQLGERRRLERAPRLATEAPSGIRQLYRAVSN